MQNTYGAHRVVYTPDEWDVKTKLIILRPMRILRSTWAIPLTSEDLPDLVRLTQRDICQMGVGKKVKTNFG